MDKKIYGIFVAGGSGTRMGTDTPKQFLDLGGRPVLQQTILKFTEALPSMKVVVVLPKDHFATWKSLCEEHRFDVPQILVEGGITRFHSVRNALEKIPDGAVVMVHDGVRPLISAELIHRLVEGCDGRNCVIPVSPVTDTLKSLEPGTLQPTGQSAPDRSTVFGAQTPQVFPSEILREAYSQGYRDSFTDDASVVEAKEIPLTYVVGERYNLKITTPDDLKIARLLFLYPDLALKGLIK